MDAFDEILRELREDMASTAAHLTRGMCNSYEDYRFLCGKLGAFERAINVVTNIKNRMEQDDE